MEFLITVILTIIADIIFFRFMADGASKANMFMLIVFIMPIATGIFISIFSWLSELICDALGWDSAPTPSEPKREKYLDAGTIARCDVLLKVADAIERSDLQMKYDPNVRWYARNVRVYQYSDSYEAANWCFKFENLLIYYKSSVATLDEGYTWLRSVGEI